ncbi:MAG: di-trans,poly-cis-decaprenylcistransferase [Rhodospirillaceae bacterium TMED8]|nr:di-trans,poly-cis-decaprenylcistransferase [Magnetovibrio sp.]OUT51668.1 MAG: di-trans,poly-cis-decaprenylcistransferase [Rhodospirillaceae bacterium TMED8]|tara:strand:- start:843 stop:1592 length:750 start_codon:yes stop_codon:yes gene_type:complete
MHPVESRLPKFAESPRTLAHLAIIMDGNGRWAKTRGLPRTAGHQQGAEAVRRTVKSAITHGIRYLTLYGFSSENWSRPPQEIRDLMGLLRLYLKRELHELDKNGVRFRVIGDRQRLDEDIVSLITDAEHKTAGNDHMTMTVALSYGSRAEITMAVKQISEETERGRLRSNDISERTISDYLYTSDLPDPDLLIRTGGEQRVSNFLLWQIAYTELVFVDKHWPEFNEEILANAIAEFQSRERRFGTTLSP